MVDPPEPSRTYQPTTHNWPRSTMDSIRVSEALDPRSIRGEATIFLLVFYPEPVSSFISKRLSSQTAFGEV